MAPHVILRPAGAADVDAVAALASTPDRALVRLHAADGGEESLIVAERRGAVIGAVSVRWTRGCDAPNPWLYGLGVRLDCRRQGVGTELVRAVEDLARARGAAATSLDVDRDQHALVQYYQGLGYQRIAEHNHVWKEIDPETALVLASGTVETWIMRRVL